MECKWSDTNPERSGEKIHGEEREEEDGREEREVGR